MSENPKQETFVNHLQRVQCSDVFRSGTNFVLHAIFTMLTITAVINRTADPQTKRSLKTPCFDGRLSSPSRYHKLHVK